MKDRVPTSQGRVLITPEDGSAAFYATITRADNPTQIGDPLSKATLLQDATAALFGLDDSAVPDDMFRIMAGASGGFVYITTKTSSGEAVPGIPVMVDDDYAGKTSANGEGLFPVSYGTHTVKLVKPLDIASITPSSFRIDVYSTGAQKLSSVCVLSNDTSATLSADGIYGFSDRVADFDACVAGAGAGGTAGVIQSSKYAMNAPGGGGGYVTNLFGILAAKFNAFSVAIGVAGKGGSVVVADMPYQYLHAIGTDGGSSSMKSLIENASISAAGGRAAATSGTYASKGGDGGSGGGGAHYAGGSGAGGTDGSDGESASSSSSGTVSGGTGQGTTTRPFEDSSLAPLSPGGGGAEVHSSSGSRGIAQANGSPGVYSVSSAVSAAKGTVKGSGGGGAAALATSGTVSGADGVDGVIMLRWRLKAA